MTKDTTDVKKSISRNRKTAEQAKDDLKNTPQEKGGREGLDPTRYGDWEKGGKCVDF
jgi:hypothetical protein